MVGGVVIEVAEVPGRPDVLFVDCASRDGSKRAKPDTCAIYVQKTAAANSIEIGDSIWWQGGMAMWTSKAVRESGYKFHKSGIDYDIKIPRVGYSGVKHPSRAEQ